MKLALWVEIKVKYTPDLTLALSDVAAFILHINVIEYNFHFWIYGQWNSMNIQSESQI